MSELIDEVSLLHTEFWFYGVDGNVFNLDGVFYEVLEDENDGYRSSMEGLNQLSAVEAIERNLVTLALPLARVTVEEALTLDGYQLVAISDQHVWLTFGTDVRDDYYPMFIFDYTPNPEGTVFTMTEVRNANAVVNDITNKTHRLVELENLPFIQHQREPKLAQEIAKLRGELKALGQEYIEAVYVFESKAKR